MDKCVGLDFFGIIYPEEVGLDPNIAFKSSPSGGKYIENVLDDLNITKEDSIIDVGCGKGNAMRTMLRYPFARIDGVELSEHIAAIAIRNFRKLKVRRSTIFVMDASVFEDFDPYNLIYFSNPFAGEIMSKVIDHLIFSVQRIEREVVIIYNNPCFHDEIVRQGQFTKIGDYPADWGNRIYVYSSVDKENCRLNR